MSVSEVFNQWIKDQICANDPLWFHELNALYKVFPHLSPSGTNNNATNKENLKQRYDRLYPQIYDEQGMAFDLLLSNQESVVLASQDNLYLDMEKWSEEFQQATIVERKTLLTRWNYRIAKQVMVSSGGQQQQLVFQGLTEFPDMTLAYLLRHYPNLRSLVIYNCGFYHLPKNFGDLGYLQELCVRDSALKALPRTFKRLRKLEKLTITGTQLTYLPDTIAELPRLMELHVEQNHIRNLPQNKSFLEFLAKVGLSREEILTAQRTAADDVNSSLASYWSSRLSVQLSPPPVEN